MQAQGIIIQHQRSVFQTSNIDEIDQLLSIFEICSKMTDHFQYCSANASSSASANADANFGVTYTLYLEHLGGFLPLLKGKKVSKIRPEFVIYDPSLNGEI